MNETFTYQYNGLWSIRDEPTRELVRDEVITFEVECEYPPKVWEEMEDEYTDEFSEIMSESYSEVIVDYDCETEYHEGCEDYWRTAQCIFHYKENELSGAELYQQTHKKVKVNKINKAFNSKFINHMRRIKGMLPALPNINPKMAKEYMDKRRKEMEDD